ncbi:MAG: 16S rRNA (cytidine(1402)-2'-O)-methyltransferase [Coriobacteriia bacterium]
MPEPSTRSPGRLLVCATPIGNLGDVTLRVLEALKSADLIAAEDTRVTRRLLARYAISTPLERCDENTVARQAPLLVAQMLGGKTIAFVSDAGTPGVSDPGARLIAAALEGGVATEALPGASALLAALVVSGLPMKRFYFGGFLPRKAGERAKELAALSALDATLVFFESPRRAAASLEALAKVYPGRQAALARELTKIHEEVVRGSIGEVAAAIAERGDALKGEVVLLVGPPVQHESAPAPDEEVQARVSALVGEGLSKSAAVRRAAEELGMSRARVYEIAHRGGSGATG